MITLPGYNIVQQIYEDSNALIYRGYRDADKKPVVIKLLKAEYPSLNEVSQFKYEYELMSSLKGEGSVICYGLEPYENSFLMIMEQFGTASLKEVLAKGSLAIPEFLDVASKLVDAIEKIHQHNIIHKDINPSNILWDEKNRQIKIIDFGSATLLAHEEPELTNVKSSPGMLPYLSPEQTGKMNRGVDYRTDFYSLGIVFYEMITGKQPFEVTDMLELIHAHIARMPASPSQLNPAIPQTLSNIIFKLMSKSAENRYQSSYGIKSDIEHCLQEIKAAGKISEFKIGEHDVSSTFSISEKLYGRENEVAVLLESFNRASNDGIEIILVSGHPGVGKSRLIHEIHKPVVEKKGYFIFGKYDQFKHNIPYSAITQAFEELVNQMLSTKEDVIANWRERILNAVGKNAKVIMDVIPSLVEIIGPQPPVAELGSIETQNRFNLVFRSFVQALSSEEHPLAVFLDDLQWADNPSLNLIETILKYIDSKYVLIIGAYRDNEVSPTHPLMSMIKENEKHGITPKKIDLMPLHKKDIDQLLMDTLHSNEQDVAPLSQICFEKTHGNPFFLIQFLKLLHKENLITFDANKGKWTWDITSIKQKGFTDNVVEFMAKKVSELPTSTQHVLQLAACLGNRFDIDSLSTIAEESPPQVSEELWPALQEGLVIPLNDAYKYIEYSSKENAMYQFLHDRVQQAAYELTEEKDLQEIHLNIGRLLLKKHESEKNTTEYALDIANHFNMGISLITDPKEKEETAKFNLIAGQRAKQCIAYEQALMYFKNGISLLKENCWDSQYDLTLSLYNEAAESAYLSKDFDSMNNFIDIVVKKSKNTLDKTKVYLIKISHYTIQEKLREVVKIAVKALKSLGMPITSNPGRLRVLWTYLITRWQMRGKTADIIFKNETITDDPYATAIIKLMTSSFSASYLINENLTAMYELTSCPYALRLGNTQDSAVVYLGYGIILCTVFHEVEKGYQYAKLALKIVNRLKFSETKPLLTMVFHSIMAHWRRPVSESIPALKQTLQDALEIGDLVVASSCAFSYIATLFYAGKELKMISEEAKNYSHFLLTINDKTYRNFVIIIWRTVLRLLNYSEDEIAKLGAQLDDEKIVKTFIEKHDNEGLCLFYIHKAYYYYMRGDYAKALEFTDPAIFYSRLIQGKEFYFLPSLIYIEAYQSATAKEKLVLLKKIKENLHHLKIWAKESPSNYLHKYQLACAEYARLWKRKNQAAKLYNSAISLAKKNGYLQDEALANELAAKFYLAQDNDALTSFIAKGYINNAYYCYSHWGAILKTNELENKYPRLLAQEAESILETKLTSSVKTSGKSQKQMKEFLDLAAIMKAAQTISRELELDELLRKMIQIVIENAGAQKGFLLLEKERKWLIEAAGEVDKTPVVLQSLSGENLLPTSIINYVIHSKKTVLIDDATHYDLFLSDPYIIHTQPKSILCVPLLNQSALSGILYLENNLAVNAFTRERVGVVNLLSSQIITSVDNARLYYNTKLLNKAYARFVPEEFLSLLGKKDIVNIELGNQIQKEMSVLVCDIRNFTTLSEKMTPKENIDFINAFLSHMSPIINQQHGFIDKYIGDAIMALYPEASHPDDALDSAIAMLQALETFNQERMGAGLSPVGIGIGVNSGLLMLGTIGAAHRMEGTVISDAVNLAFRIQNLTKTYQTPILITEETYKKLKHPNFYCVRKIDTVLVKGKLNLITIYEVFDNDPEALIALKSQMLHEFEDGVDLFQKQKYSDALAVFKKIFKLNPHDLPASLYIQRCQEILSRS